MEVHTPTGDPRAPRRRPWVWLIALAVAGASIYALTSYRLAPLPRARAVEPVVVPAPSTGPITAEVITSRAADRYEYVADVLRQLSTHAQAACRDELSGPQSLQEELAKANALKAQGQLRDASLVLTAIEKRLDRKFQMACLKLG